jgi:hypothetical protein
MMTEKKLKELEEAPPIIALAVPGAFLVPAEELGTLNLSEFGGEHVSSQSRVALECSSVHDDIPRLPWRFGPGFHQYDARRNTFTSAERSAAGRTLQIRFELQNGFHRKSEFS